MRLDLPPTLALLAPVDPELAANLASARLTRRLVRERNEQTLSFGVFNGVDLTGRERVALVAMGEW